MLALAMGPPVRPVLGFLARLPMQWPSNRPVGGAREVDQIEDPGDVAVAGTERGIAVDLEFAAERIDQPVQAALMQAESALQRIADDPGECRGGCGEQHEPAGR